MIANACGRWKSRFAVCRTHGADARATVEKFNMLHAPNNANGGSLEQRVDYSFSLPAHCNCWLARTRKSVPLAMHAKKVISHTRIPCSGDGGYALRAVSTSGAGTRQRGTVPASDNVERHSTRHFSLKWLEIPANASVLYFKVPASTPISPLRLKYRQR